MSIDWFGYQQDTLDAEKDTPPHQGRVCLYFRTGAGKTLTALGLMQQWGVRLVWVIAPPSTHEMWKAAGKKLGITVIPVSHAKFRQKNFALSRTDAVIADEFHLFGGQQGQGWKKLDRLSKGLLAPLVLASATPNYNDAERCYCIQHILNPASCKGGFLEFLYQNCKTEQNPFGMMPKVTGFLRHPDAEGYLAALPHVYYVPDNVQYTINDIVVFSTPPLELEEFGYNRRKHRVVASQIEMRHTVTYQSLVDVNGVIHTDLMRDLMKLITEATTPVLVYANHATVAVALANSLIGKPIKFGLVTGKTRPDVKEHLLQSFRDGKLDVLVGTASLATGTDGLDKVCDNLVIFDDTDDAALRRQLIGRIMPRGESVDSSMKKVSRFVLS